MNTQTSLTQFYFSNKFLENNGHYLSLTGITNLNNGRGGSYQNRFYQRTTFH